MMPIDGSYRFRSFGKRASGCEAGKRWADAIRLLAEVGLRPVELLHLRVRLDATTGDPYLWCTYQKRSGGGDTHPRRDYPLAL